MLLSSQKRLPGLVKMNRPTKDKDKILAGRSREEIIEKLETQYVILKKFPKNFNLLASFMQTIWS